MEINVNSKNNNHPPIIICNRDRLATTRRLVIDLMNLGYTDIHILDIASSYPPLLKWYDHEHLVDVTRLKINIGHKALWNSNVLSRFSHHPYVVYTDSDIQLNENTPQRFIENMVGVAEEYNMDKVGLAIEYRDITNPVYNEIIPRIESGYWKNKRPDKNYTLYNAPVDTTFCVVRTDRPFTYDAIRIAGDYTCKHAPWYSDWDNISEEELYYMNHADSRIATCVQHYNKWKTNKNENKHITS